MKNSIEVINVTKDYGNFKLDNVSLTVPEGTIVGLVGENGAGKTTLIKSILNIINIDSGEINILENKNITKAKEEVGVVLDGSFFAEIIKVKELNKIMKQVYKNWDEQLFNKYLVEFQIPDKQIIKELSKGMRKKLEIATALSHHPKLLILDEPTSGLDPVVRNEILDIFLNFIQESDHSILLSSHITSDLEHIADYITFVHDGKIILSKEKDDLIENYCILKCKEEDFGKIDKKDILRYKKNRYNYDILVNDKKIAKKKYPSFIADNASIDDIMLLYIKGDK